LSNQDKESLKKEEINELWSTFHVLKNKEDCEEYKKVREKIIIHYLPFVRQIAGRIAVKVGGFFSQEDLESYGIIGLMEAVDKFDIRFNVRFEAFAYHRIKGAIIDEIRRQSWIPRVSWRKKESLREAKEKLRQMGKEVNIDNLSEITGIPKEEIQEIMNMSNSDHIYSLDEKIHNHKGDVICRREVVRDMNVVDPLEEIAQKEDVESLMRAIGALKERDKLVLALYYQEGLTLKEIGKVLGVSESRVCQLHAHIIKKLKKILKNHSK